jgi:DNA-binding MarR family transcriptional regulator
MNRQDGRANELALQNISQLMRNPYQHFIGRVIAEMEQAGYGDIQASHALLFQHLRAEGSRVTDLAHRMQLTKQYVGRLVDQLESFGYLERLPDPADGRGKLVRLSSRGEEATRVAERIIRRIEADWAHRFGEHALAELRRQLIELNAMLEE